MHPPTNTKDNTNGGGRERETNETANQTPNTRSARQRMQARTSNRHTIACVGTQICAKATANSKKGKEENESAARKCTGTARSVCLGASVMQKCIIFMIISSPQVLVLVWCLPAVLCHPVCVTRVRCTLCVNRFQFFFSLLTQARPEWEEARPLAP